MNAKLLIEVASEGEASGWQGLLARLNALQTMYQVYHWKSKGDSYYGDHLLFERLYTETNKSIDGVAERALGTTDDPAIIHPVLYLSQSLKIVSDWADTGLVDDVRTCAEMSLEAEQDTIGFIEDMIRKFEAQGTLTGGVEDLLQSIIASCESHIYLLRQRLRQ